VQIGVSQTTTQVSLSNVAQTGNTTAMTIRQPAFQFSEEDIFVQGANFGLEFRY